MDAPITDVPASPPARFGDRLNAFALDAALFVSSFVLTVLAAAAARRGAPPSPALLGACAVFWASAFFFYHAYLAAAGRQTMGKRLFGLSVRTMDGEALSFTSSLARSFAYPLSSLPLNLGFLWALRKEGRAWHDLIADSRVVELSPGSGRFRAASAVASWLLAGVMTVAWFGLVVIGPGLSRMKLLAQARIGLKSLAVLQDERMRSTGAYTADLSELLDGTSAEAAEARRALRFHLNQNTVRLTVDGASYAIEAEARDKRRTVLRLDGPLRP